MNKNIIFSGKCKARWWIMSVVVGIAQCLTAQDQIEYFWNSDPGIGKAAKVTAKNGEVQFSLSTESLPEGVNLLGIRAIDGDYYSSTLLHTIIKASAFTGESRVEYFWDKDPGMGNATVYPVNMSGKEPTIQLSIPTDTLSPGAHLLGLRIFNGAWSQTYFQICGIMGNEQWADKLEFFWDKDPGYGMGTKLDVVSENGVAKANFAIPADTLSEGIHLLGLRVGSGDTWSHTNTALVAVSHGGSMVKSAEYFWDKDPGIGNATTYPVKASGEEPTIQLSIPTDTLSPGAHLLGLRLFNGAWSQTYFQICGIMGNGLWADKLEYFWDKDPGYGMGTQLDVISEDGVAKANFAIPADTLSEGVHLLGLRVGSGNTWSHTTTTLVAISHGSSKVETMEYFWDDDPGIGLATPYEADASTNDSVYSMQLSTDTLSNGIHLLGIRAFCGTWSQTQLSYVAISKDGGIIERVEYYWDTDPGYGKANTLPFMGDTLAIVNEDIPAPADYGTHVLFVRALSNGNWSAPLIQKFCMNATPMMELPKDTFCVGEQFIVFNMTEGATDATTYSWDMNGDGKEDSNTDDAFVYSYTKAGTYMASLGVKTVGDCVTTCYVPVVVLPTDAPKVTLSATTKTLCAGDAIRLKATATNAGEQPEFEWLLNGEVIATTLADTLIMEELAHNDKVQVRVISSNPCASIDNALSSQITFRVNPLPEVSIAHYFPIYTDEAALILTGGMPEGGKYYINDKEEQLFNPKRYEPGSYSLRYSYTNSNGCTSEAVTSFVLRDTNEASLLKGDVNKDENVDVMDILCEVDLIYGRIFPTYTMNTADVNEDKTINVTDIVGISGIILGEHAVAKALSVRHRSSTTDSYALKAMDAAGTDEVMMHFTLSSTVDICGVQFDVTMPEGVELTSATPGLVVGRKQGTENNTYTLLAYSTSLGSVPGTLSVKATLPVNMEEGVYPIVLQEAILVNADMSEKPCALTEGQLLVGDATGMKLTTSGIRVMVVDKGLHILGATGSVAMLTDAAGHFVMAEEVTGSDFLMALPSIPTGTYVIEIVNETSPVKVKFLWK